VFIFWGVWISKSKECVPSVGSLRKKCIKGVRQDWPPKKKTNQILLEAHALGTRPSSETLGSTQTAGVDTWKAAKAEELLSQMMVLTVRPNEFSSLDI